MSETLAFAQFVTLHAEESTTSYRFQNYWINEDATLSSDASIFGFMPFVFNGITISKSGDNQPASLVFPNNELSRGWAESAVVDRWIADVSTVMINPDDKTENVLISRYIGQIVSGRWDSTTLQLQMASVLDAAGSDIPRKRLTKQLVGSLPLTSSVRVA